MKPGGGLRSRFSACSRKRTERPGICGRLAQSFPFGSFRCAWQLGSRRGAMSLCKWLSLAVVMLLAAGVAVAGPTPLQATNTWMGSIDDEKLAKEMPETGVITNARDFAKLVKAWQVAEQAPEVDFDKEIVLVAKTEGSRLTL